MQFSSLKQSIKYCNVFNTFLAKQQTPKIKYKQKPNETLSCVRINPVTSINQSQRIQRFHKLFTIIKKSIAMKNLLTYSRCNQSSQKRCQMLVHCRPQLIHEKMTCHTSAVKSNSTLHVKVAMYFPRLFKECLFSASNHTIQSEKVKIANSD